MDINCAKRQRCGILCRRLSHKLMLHIGKEPAIMSFCKVLLRLLQCLSCWFAWPDIIRSQQKLSCADSIRRFRQNQFSELPVASAVSLLVKCCGDFLKHDS